MKKLLLILSLTIFANTAFAQTGSIGSGTSSMGGPDGRNSAAVTTPNTPSGSSAVDSNNPTLGSKSYTGYKSSGAKNSNPAVNGGR